MLWCRYRQGGGARVGIVAHGRNVDFRGGEQRQWKKRDGRRYGTLAETEMTYYRNEIRVPDDQNPFDRPLPDGRHFGG